MWCVLCGVFTGSRRRMADCALHHEVPAHNVMTQPTFAPLADALTAFYTGHSHPTRLLSILKRVEDATGSCLGQQVPPGRDVIGGSVETFSGRDDWSLYLPCQMQMARVYASPNQMLPQTTPYPLGPDPRRRR